VENTGSTRGALGDLGRCSVLFKGRWTATSVGGQLIPAERVPSRSFDEPVRPKPMQVRVFRRYHKSVRQARFEGTWYECSVRRLEDNGDDAGRQHETGALRALRTRALLKVRGAVIQQIRCAKTSSAMFADSEKEKELEVRDKERM